MSQVKQETHETYIAPRVTFDVNAGKAFLQRQTWIFFKDKQTNKQKRMA